MQSGSPINQRRTVEWRHCTNTCLECGTIRVLSGTEQSLIGSSVQARRYWAWQNMQQKLVSWLALRGLWLNGEMKRRNTSAFIPLHEAIVDHTRFQLFCLYWGCHTLEEKLRKIIFAQGTWRYLPFVVVTSAYVCFCHNLEIGWAKKTRMFLQKKSFPGFA